MIFPKHLVTMNCEMETKGIYKQMWNSLPIQNIQQDERKDIRSHRWIERKEQERASSHCRIALSCTSRDNITEDSIAITSTAGDTMYMH